MGSYGGSYRGVTKEALGEGDDDSREQGHRLPV